MWPLIFVLGLVLVGGLIFAYLKWGRPPLENCGNSKCGEVLRGKFVDCSPAGPNPLNISNVMVRVKCTSCKYTYLHI